MAFSNKLTLLRRETGISQETLAEICNVSRQSVSKWEKGICEPDIATLILLSRHFSITLDELLTAPVSEVEMEQAELDELLKKRLEGITDPEIYMAVHMEVERHFIHEMIERLKKRGDTSKQITNHIQAFVSIGADS